MTYEELVGERLVLGIEGSRLSAEVVEIFQKTQAGGLILFRRNVESAEGLRRLIRDLEHSLGRRLLVMVDHEGGRVIHLGEGITVFPDAAALGAGGNVEWARRQGEIEALELRRLGIDLNLAPVLDVLGEFWNPAIGTRAYGKDPELVAALGRARIEGLQSKGLSACGKHYPGLGAARFDPHQELPTIRKSWQAIQKEDLPPFLGALAAGVDSLMSSHPIYSAVDRKLLPATFSRKIIHDTLRRDFGFKGVLLTDDLKMGAISKAAPLKEAAPLAAEAGHDLLLICSDPAAQLEVFESLLRAYKKKELKLDELEASVERIQALKQKRKERFGKGEALPEKGGEELAQEIAWGGAKVLNDGKGLLPLSPAWCLKHSVSVLFPDLREIARKFFVEPETLDTEVFLRNTFQKFGASFKFVYQIPVDPSAKERGEILEIASPYELVLFFCSDAHLFPGTQALLKLLEAKAGRLAVIFLREPRDFDGTASQTASVTAHGFRRSQIEAAIERLFSPV